MISERLECIRLALAFHDASHSTPHEVIDTARLFLKFADEEQKLDRRSKKEEKESKPKLSKEPIDASDGEREEKIRSLLASLPADDRIVMRAVLGRVETKDLERTFNEYRHKL